MIPAAGACRLKTALNTGYHPVMLPYRTVIPTDTADSSYLASWATTSRSAIFVR